MRPNPRMLLRHTLVVVTFVVGALLSSCATTGEVTPFEPLVGGEPVAVSLVTTADIPLSGLPRLEISATAAEVNARWEVEGVSCLIAQATASRVGSVIEIQLHRGGNPLANCVAARVGYQYMARVTGLAQGRFEVRLVDVFADQPAVAIGRKSVVVGAVFVVD